MPRTPEGQHGKMHHVSDVVYLPYAIAHYTAHILCWKQLLGMQNKFLVKKLTLRRYLVSSGLIIYLPREQRHSWRGCSGAGGTACSQTYRTAMKRDIKRLYGFMFLSCAGRHRGQKNAETTHVSQKSSCIMWWIFQRGLVQTMACTVHCLRHMLLQLYK